MRYFLLILCAVLVFYGCSSPSDGISSAPDQAIVPEETFPTSAVEETEPPQTVYTDPIQSFINGMTIEERVGQLFLARCSPETALADMEAYHLGGFVLFSQNFENETPDSIRETLRDYQLASRLPLLIAVDEEGGTVTRISRYPAFRSTRFPSSREAYTQGGMAGALEMEEEKCRLLSDLGLNVNLGPVCDLSDDPAGFMYPRSLGETPETTGEFVAFTVNLMERQGIGSVLKHFPGYGNNADTHVGIARDQRTLEELERRDLIPFTYGIQAGCGAILISHTIVEFLDPELPASLSPAAHDYLRRDMGYEGVILTDDLVMQAITDLYGAGEAAVMAVNAGNDLLCSTEYGVQYEAVLAAVLDDRISMKTLDAAVYRVLKWKMDLGLI